MAPGEYRFVRRGKVVRTSTIELRALPTSCALTFCCLSSNISYLLCFNTPPTMSSHENDELIDYEDENDATTTALATATNGSAAAKTTEAAPEADGDKEKRGHVGVHSTGFR